ncbi:hypothetical protein BDK51DRAFT_36449, partial [Blyttiomyces helicus]
MASTRGGRVIEEWEARNDLLDRQKESIVLLQEACADLPFPKELADQEDDDDAPAQYLTSVPPTPLDAFAAGAVPWRDDVGKGAVQSRLGIDDPIETAQQFFGWFSSIEEEMEKGQEDTY